ncbi:MAG TPA: hypothetical protein VFL36_11585, partial [Myxococcales bacterium]|nr:hypothetical protein [Myxococcales bacterium]
VWIDDELIDAGRKAGVDFTKERDSLLTELEGLRPESRISRVVEAAIAEVLGLLQPSGEEIEKLRNRLLNNGKINKVVNE